MLKAVLGLGICPGRFDASSKRLYYFNRDLCKDVADIARMGVDIIVSVVPQDELKEKLYVSHYREVVEASGLELREYPIEGEYRSFPRDEDRQKFSDFVTDLSHQVKQGKNVLVHCRNGLGRSAIVLSCTLVALGAESETAVKRLTEICGQDCPKKECQRKYVHEFADRIKSQLQ
ncbi:hypothetical protein M3P05_17060 [Sansalvadorimonas sp. 2012CJ34-2]|uniref:Tyrosine specific protein phosphatases domain-containing protein n=1 Tax=Parendozoicomonas callyspongiae TaxID=2942213 RepID=A0ABT0PJR6_9GAMM|nr:protein-tyrosine phosphatase family protein [Sansalvadorimonas sp. 2012CJ34-2]MCL6271629.1 hypothetical protein [Sansalvadorimonas sp. 2012CJ34-2]